MSGFTIFNGRGNAKSVPIPRDSMHRVDDQPYRERMKALGAKLGTSIEAEQHGVVGVTSSVAGEGKTLLAANLALHLAATAAKKVLLVDTDLRKTGIADYFAIARSPGLCEFLEQQIDVPLILRKSPHPNLVIMATGKLAGDPAALLAGGRFQAFLETVRRRFDVTVLDTPPVIPAADTLGFRDQVTGFLFVFRAGFTPHSVLRQAVEEIGENKVLGVVLNGVDPKSPRFYQRYYGSYYQRPVKGQAP